MNGWREVEPGKVWTNDRAFVSLEIANDPKSSSGKSAIYYVRQRSRCGAMSGVMGSGATLRHAQQEAERLAPD